ncbi:MAG TPA: CHASE2 domain-containing protein [Vitreimonas sp.]|nr:CHASE2 domain-containing protein [Vitreimonas sp.]
MGGIPASPLKRFVLLTRQWPALIAFVFVLATDVFNSFGLNDAADVQAASITNVMTAPFYGADARPGQNAITVVVIDDYSRQQQHWPAPPPYGAQGDIISTIAMYQPAAIFFDFSYGAPHGENAALEIQNLAQRIKDNSSNGGPPIFIGAVSDDPDLAPLREIPSVGVTWTAQSWLPYPFYNGRQEMAAPRLYQEWCAYRQRTLGADAKCSWRPPANGELSLQWGFGASAAMRDASPPPEACALRDTRFASRLRAAARNTWLAFIGQMPPSCVYSDTLNAATLLQQADPEGLERLIKGRIVLVGTSYREAGDIQDIPNVGKVPGVYVHAMALDNLIERGANYTRPAPNVPGFGSLGWPDLIEIVMGFTLYLAAWFFFDRRSKAERSGAGALATFAVVGLALVFAASFLEAALHWPPLNILGVLVFVFAIFEYVHQRKEKS